MATQLSKSQLIEKIATTTELSKRDVKNVMETLTDVGHKELKKNGVFLVPGFAKFVVVKKPAVKARKGGIVLMHEIHPNTLAKLDTLIERLLAEGFRFAPLTDPAFEASLR